MWLIERKESALRNDDIAGVDSFDQSLFELFDSLDESVVGRAQLKVLRASREFESVRVTEVRLIRRLYVDVVSVLDRAESVRETIQFVTGQQLLMKIIVNGSLTNLTLLTLGALLLVLLYRRLLLSLLERILF